MTDRELMQQALDWADEHLRVIYGMGGATTVSRMTEWTAAFRARLAQPEQEPLAWWQPNEYKIEKSFSWHKKGGFIKPLYTAPPQQPERKLWLWKNFVDGRPEYWAFDNPYPTNLDNGDPQTLGQPCGYAIFKPSRDGSRGRTEEQVLREMESVSARSEREWQTLTDEEVESLDCTTVNACDWNEYEVYKPSVQEFARAIEAKLKEKNIG